MVWHPVLKELQSWTPYFQILNAFSQFLWTTQHDKLYLDSKKVRIGLLVEANVRMFYLLFKSIKEHEIHEFHVANTTTVSFCCHISLIDINRVKKGCIYIASEIESTWICDRKPGRADDTWKIGPHSPHGRLVHMLGSTDTICCTW